ncbi:MAG: (2Fe-2S) ferredoxin domain-containing protein [Planctomycetota bacterium]
MTERNGSASIPAVALCCGKDCVKDKGFAELREALSERCDVRETRCLGLCKGPLVILNAPTCEASLSADVEPVVLKRVAKPKQRRDLLKAILDGAPLSERLRRRVVNGKARRSALAKASRRPKK